jgi:hypothetical protein
MREAGPAVVVPQTLDVGVGQAQRLERSLQVARFLARIDVDPQEALGSQRPDDLLGQLDATVMGVRIEEADGEVAQCSALNRIAAPAATKATTYWSASIVRSWAGSASHDPLCLVAGSNSIDV